MYSDVTIVLPTGKTVTLRNGAQVSDIALGGLSFAELSGKYPEGRYVIRTPTRVLLQLNLTYAFASTPQITYPRDGQTGVPLAPVVSWQPVTGANDNLFVTLERQDEAVELAWSLPVCVGADTIPVVADSELTVQRCINFRTRP